MVCEGASLHHADCMDSSQLASPSHRRSVSMDEHPLSVGFSFRALCTPRHHTQKEIHPNSRFFRSGKRRHRAADQKCTTGSTFQLWRCLVLLFSFVFMPSTAPLRAHCAAPSILLTPQMPPPSAGGWMLCRRCGWSIAPSLSLRSGMYSVRVHMLVCILLCFVASTEKTTEKTSGLPGQMCMPCLPALSSHGLFGKLI
jgi:hypothetical protein